MIRSLALAALLVGCSSSYDEPPSVFGGRPPETPDSGPPRICGVVPGSACEPDGEITRCLCGRFEDQIGRFVCCRKGVAVASECQEALYARDCDGNPAAKTSDAAAD